MTISITISHDDPDSDKGLYVIQFDKDTPCNSFLIKPGDQWEGYIWDTRSIRIYEAQEEITREDRPGGVQPSVPQEQVSALQ